MTIELFASSGRLSVVEPENVTSWPLKIARIVRLKKDLKNCQTPASRLDRWHISSVEGNNFDRSEYDVTLKDRGRSVEWPCFFPQRAIKQAISAIEW
jgi:hypothetical protein